MTQHLKCGNSVTR